MDFIKIIRSIEAAIFEIAMWIILIPKTFFQVLFFPSRITKYIHDEQLKKEEEQYADRMSPVMFWILLVIIPGYFAIKYFNNLFEVLKVKSVENGLIFLSVTFISLLLSPAILIHLFGRIKFDKKSFKESFLIQCYVQTPFAVVLTLCFSLLKYLGYNFSAMEADDYSFFTSSVNGWKDILILPVTAVMIWFVYAEIKIIKQQIGKTTGKAFLILILSYFLFAIIFIIMGMLGTLMFWNF